MKTDSGNTNFRVSDYLGNCKERNIVVKLCVVWNYVTHDCELANIYFCINSFVFLKQISIALTLTVTNPTSLGRLLLIVIVTFFVQ